MHKQPNRQIRLEKKTFRQLFEEYYTSLCIYANSILHDLVLAQDIVSDCFVRIWEKRADIQIKTSVKHYLFLSVRNAIFSYLRSPENRKIDAFLVIERLEEIPVEADNPEQDADILRVLALIEQLPEQRKRILKLATYEGKTYKEIAEQLGISVNTVNTQMSRAYRFLREELGN